MAILNKRQGSLNVMATSTVNSLFTAVWLRILRHLTCHLCSANPGKWARTVNMVSKQRRIFMWSIWYVHRVVDIFFLHILICKLTGFPVMCYRMPRATNIRFKRSFTPNAISLMNLSILFAHIKASTNYSVCYCLVCVMCLMYLK